MREMSRENRHKSRVEFAHKFKNWGSIKPADETPDAMERFFQTPLRLEREPMPQGRVCQHCPTKLSVWNEKPYCSCCAKRARFEEVRTECLKYKKIRPELPKCEQPM